MKENNTPKEWKVKTLGNICISMVGGGTPSTSHKEYWNGNIPWMTSAHITNRYVTTGQKYITKKGLEKSASKLVPQENLLVATRVGIGKAAINKIDIAISQDLTGLFLDKTVVLPEYVYWHLTHKQNNIKSLAQGSTIKGVLRSDLARLKISLPPLPEQQKIADVLSTVDSAIDIVERERRAVERLKVGIMKKLFDGKKWPKVKLTDIAEYINGYAFSPKDWQTKGMPIIRIQNLTDPDTPFNYYKGKIDERYIIQKGDILFPWSASIGVHIWTKENAYLNQHIFKVVPKEGVEKDYLYYALFLAIKQLNKKIHGSTMKHFKRGELEKTFIPLPPQSEQKRISNILLTLDKKLSLQSIQKQKLERIKQGLMNDLLTGKKRVKLL